MYNFLIGMLAALCWVAGCFFFRFYLKVKDRLFLSFGIAFWTFSAEWIVLCFKQAPEESDTLVYVIRLLGFLLILYAIVDKNFGFLKRKPGSIRLDRV